MKALVTTTSIASSTDLIAPSGFYGTGWPFIKDTWRLIGSHAQNTDLFKLCAAKSLKRDIVIDRVEQPVVPRTLTRCLV